MQFIQLYPDPETQINAVDPKPCLKNKDHSRISTFVLLNRTGTLYPTVSGIPGSNPIKKKIYGIYNIYISQLVTTGWQNYPLIKELKEKILR